MIPPKIIAGLDAEANRLTIERLGHALPDASFAGAIIPTAGAAMLLIVFSHLAGVRYQAGLLIDGCSVAFGLLYFCVQRHRANVWIRTWREHFDRLCAGADDEGP